MGKRKGGKLPGANSASRTKVTDPEGATLEEWLTKMCMNDPELFIIRQRFPHESWKDEYIATIAARTEEEVLFLIRSFLIQSGFTNRCDICYMGLMEAKKTNPEFYRKALADPFTQRLVRYAEEPDAGYPPPWEGNTWIADLLPDNPKLALQGLEAYIHAYRWHFSDNQIWGHKDVEQLIRAKFIGLPGSGRNPIELIDGNHLIPLMNHHLGSRWALQVDHLVWESLAPGVHIHSARE
jgi:restriction system protein